jgi:hypothetical protein
MRPSSDGLHGLSSIPNSARIFSSPQHPGPIGVHPTSYRMVSESLSIEVKQQEHVADHSHPSSADFKKSGNIPPVSHISSWHSAYLITRKTLSCFYNVFTFPILWKLDPVSTVTSKVREALLFLLASRQPHSASE